ncbi:class I SAM-dependent methyltransferase [Flavobacterium covae]|uniref:class I SAM-dependent methyltransferase n=1 Tax=Flavobacterium covae TaxID=2906076 RepID=UPI000F4EC0BA|nr:class I SAM-dependent methyltransferase [Flavobacterium covae]
MSFSKIFYSYKFRKIYENDGFNMMNRGVSRSGPGSDLVQTKIIREEIERIINDYEINSILDIPCGDFYWMSRVSLKNVKYIGADIVKSLINNNIKKYKTEQNNFKTIDLISDKLPSVDLIIVRDLFVHLKNKQILRSIENIKNSGSKYLLVTSFLRNEKNKDIEIVSQWRPLNLMLDPFNLPKPLEIINENCTEGERKYLDKSLLLYKIEKL